MLSPPIVKLVGLTYEEVTSIAAVAMEEAGEMRKQVMAEVRWVDTTM